MKENDINNCRARYTHNNTIDNGVHSIQYINFLESMSMMSIMSIMCNVCVRVCVCVLLTIGKRRGWQQHTARDVLDIGNTQWRKKEEKQQHHQQKRRGKCERKFKI